MLKWPYAPLIVLPCLAGIILAGPLPAADTEATAGAASAEVPKEDSVPPAKKDGKPWLGIVPMENSDGVFVDMVQPDTTAEKMGLKRGDKLVKLGGEKVNATGDLTKVLSGMGIGDSLQVTFARNGAEVTTSHALLAKPESLNNHQKSLEIHGPVGVAVDRIERELKAVREALSKAGMNNPKQDLAQAMSSLSTTLDVLPGRLERAAKQFKTVYPEGEFIVNIEITIRSHPEDEVLLDLSPTGDGAEAEDVEKGAGNDAAPGESADTQPVDEASEPVAAEEAVP